MEEETLDTSRLHPDDPRYTGPDPMSGVAYDGSPLDKLSKILPTVDPELVQRRLYGSKTR